MDWHVLNDVVGVLAVMGGLGVAYFSVLYIPLKKRVDELEASMDSLPYWRGQTDTLMKSVEDRLRTIEVKLDRLDTYVRNGRT